ncbi:hypothetical protein EXIGLDRAFT_844610 [Exidia glandulosa HHB12029]|uniref:Hydrophobin n=1 Tax=Exidia glandulosa HHB12029 TaxID=1314781 RepID=A0A165BY05_EXIGL|nr:hypothetical protein EXIGLDRAFT_844610 [Exidia glandulosa HHB12029]
MQTQWNLLFTYVLLAAPAAVHSFCCFSASPPNPCGLVKTSPLELGIFNSAVGVPKGAKNVLSNETFSAIEPLAVCCCTAANSLACRSECFPGFTMTDPDSE